MLQFARSRRALTATLATAVLLATSVSQVVAGDDWIVRPGDTLWEIARRHGTSVAELVALNQIPNPSLIIVGQRIRLRPAAPASPSATPPAPADPSEPRIHVVQPGETLWGLAIRYETSVRALAEANRIPDPSYIRIGQALRIPDAAVVPPHSPPAASPAPAASPGVPEPVLYIVQHGDTLWAIAARYGTSVTALADANGIVDPGFIRIGMQLVIPGAPPASAPTTNPGMSPDMAAKVSQRTAVRDLLLRAATEFGVPSGFVLALAWHESGWQTAVVSGAGAVGVMQLMPATADWVAGSMLHEAPAITDPAWNVRAGVRLLDFYLDRYGGDRAMALAAYLQGMTSVDQSGIFTSSRPYIDNILALETIFSR